VVRGEQARTLSMKGNIKPGNNRKNSKDQHRWQKTVVKGKKGLKRKASGEKRTKNLPLERKRKKS